jgi:nicotinamide-nucleotide amidase
MDNNLQKLVEKIGNILQKHHWQLATAESCTGGLIASTITSVANCSQYFERGFITYGDNAKIEMLGVDANIIATAGAVSAATAKAMAQGVILHSHAQISLAVTGIAGPSGGTPQKPVGTVHFAWNLYPNLLFHMEKFFQGERNTIRLQAATFALEELLHLLTTTS